MEAVIRDKARGLFFSYGLKSVSMDDVARQCGISKKTLYQHFADRDALVTAVLDGLLSEHTAALQACRAAAADAVGEQAGLLESPFQLLASVNRAFFHELEKSFPAAWARLQHYSGTELRASVLANLERGIGEGNYRNDLPKDFCAALRIDQLRTALQPDAFGNGRCAPLPLMRALTLFYLHSVASEKGRKLISKYFNDTDEPANNKKK